MAQKGKHISKDDFIRYISDKMSPSERNHFERLLHQYPFEAEALEGMLLSDPDLITADLNELSRRIQGKKKFNRGWYRAVAAVLLVIIVSGVFIVLNKKQSPVVVITENRTEKNVEKGLIQLKEEEPSIENYTDTSQSENDDFTNIIINEPVLNTDELIVADEVSLDFPDTEYNETLEIADKVIETEIPEISAVSVPKGVASEALQHVVSGIEIQQAKKTNAKMAFDKNIALPASKKSVSGIILSAEDSTPVNGINVLAKGTTIGTVTDIDGNFNLPLTADSNITILASFIGMETAEISIASDSQNIIYLEPSELALDEVVTVGYDKENAQTTEQSKTRAEPVNGYSEFRKYLKGKCIIPDGYNTENNIVKVELTINESGEIINIEPINSPDSLLFKKSVKILNEGPNWNPAINNEIPVQSIVTLRLRFR
ncbi:MAG: carboxypeptidase-like regulatory domain-containing protein [Prolixibacteraceae bacterium]|nr:carboxypeptidase-like regulatory domain-containing protein [Prolixibacteraceae bacterium]MBN2774911.1 carboxypeptidase-like regulatory domain-containing protein [Prolixibacteraceae bacterium]